MCIFVEKFLGFVDIFSCIYLRKKKFYNYKRHYVDES